MNISSLIYRPVFATVVTLLYMSVCMYVDSDELLGTEILFANVLEPLNPPEVAAMLSALIFQVQSIVTYTDVCMYVCMYVQYVYIHSTYMGRI